MTEPNFLIFLPVRNGGRHVADAVASVLGQTRSDWRLIVFENASTDGTPALLRALDDPRIVVVPADRALDIHANWHRGFDWLADVPPATLVSFLGHDDLFRPRFLERIAALSAAHPQATLLQTHFDLIDEEGSVIRPCRPIPAREEWGDLAAALCWYLRDSFGTGYAFRAGDYRRVGGITDLPMLLYSDHLLWLRLTRLGYKAADPASAFAYRRHGASTSSLPSPAKFAASATALDQFVTALRIEFAPFAEDDRGRAAIAALLSRELSLLTAPLVGSSLPSQVRARLSALAGLYGDLADGVPMATLAGMPYSPSRPFHVLRRLNATQSLVRHRLFAR